MENVWEYLRANKLCNLVWDTYESVVQACKRAWDFLITDPDPQESPHLSDRTKNVGEERLLLQHLGEALHQRGQPSITHGWQ
jgi:hypothetical protein